MVQTKSCPSFGATKKTMSNPRPKALKFPSFTPGLLLVNMTGGTDKDITSYLDKFTQIKYPAAVKKKVLSILRDEFPKEVVSRASNKEYLNQLSFLKTLYLDFYLSTVGQDNILFGKYDHHCDINERLNQFQLQLERLRMVINPEIQLTVNPHKQTKIIYLTVKGFWLNDEGKKERKFSKSLGRADEYEIGKDDPRAIQEATLKIQEVLFQEYSRLYK